MKNKIAIFGGNIKGKNYLDLKKAGKKLKVNLDLISYKDICFDTEKEKILLKNKKLKEYDVYFFRNTKNYWEEVNMITDEIKRDFGKHKKKPILIDPLIKEGRSSDACKAHQMMVMSQANLPVPKTIYGTSDYLKKEGIKKFSFPLVIKGSRGDRKTQVFKVNSKDEFLRRLEKLKINEKKGENEYMLQEYVPNDENYRVMVVGKKVLGVMKRKIGDNPNLKDVYELADLPAIIKKLCVKAAKVCEISIAGVDVVLKGSDINKPLFFEVNKTPGYERFEEITGIDVASEIVKFLATVR